MLKAVGIESITKILATTLVLFASMQVQAQTNGATFLSQIVPSTMVAGQTYSVTVRMQNTGTTTWVTAATNAGSYRLGSADPQNNMTWGTNRVALPSSIAPNAIATFTFNVTAPATTGTYAFQWQMVQDQVAWIGNPGTIANVVVTPPPLVNGATYVTETVPPNMVAGQTYLVSVTMLNSGTTTWVTGTTTAGSYRLGSASPQDNTTWGTNRIALPSSTAPGSNAVFSFNVTAPTTQGTYVFSWQMVQEQVGWIGTAAPNYTVTVSPPVSAAPTAALSAPANGASYVALGANVAVPVTGSGTAAGSATITKLEVLDGTTVLTSVATNTINTTVPLTPGSHSLQLRATDSTGKTGLSAVSAVSIVTNNAALGTQSVVPTTVVAGQTFPVTIAMTNTGTSTWTTNSLYRLGSIAPQDNTTWGTKRITLPSSIAPGQTATFSFNATAPATAGPYFFQWQMVEDQVGWFGPSTTSASINVTSASALPTVTLTSPVNGASYNLSGTTASVPVSGSATPVGSATITKLEILDNGVALVPSVATNTINTTAPLAAGSHSLQLRATDSLGNVGVSAAAAITVNAPLVNGAQFTNQNVPPTMIAGQTYPITITMQNTGTSTWTPAGKFRLGSQNPDSNFTWGLNRVEVTSTNPVLSSVAPGQSATFSFTVTAPAAAGTYNFQWEMVQDQIGWFGSLTPSAIVPVTVGAAGSVTYTYDNLGRIQTIKYASGATITYTYDAAGNRATHVTTGAPN